MPAQTNLIADVLSEEKPPQEYTLSWWLLQKPISLKGNFCSGSTIRERSGDYY
jgi:hypothetical protein